MFGGSREPEFELTEKRACHQRFLIKMLPSRAVEKFTELFSTTTHDELAVLAESMYV